MTNLLILNAYNLANIFQRLRNELGFVEYHNEDLIAELRHFSGQSLSPENSYLMFYTIWVFALLENMKQADEIVNIDLLSLSEQYRKELLARLAGRRIDCLDFASCQIPQSCYTQKEKTFFQGIEERVHEMLMQNGYAQSEIVSLLDLRMKHGPTQSFRLLPGRTAGHKLLTEAARAREMVIYYEQQARETSVSCRKLENELAQLGVAREELQMQLTKLETELAAIVGSRSWRLTRPLRAIRAFLSSLRP